MPGWETPLLARLVALAGGETVPFDAALAVGLDNPGKAMSRNHVGMAVAGEALRARRDAVQASNVYAQDRIGKWYKAKERLVSYLRDELTNGLWGNEPLATTNHCEYHIAVAMFARLVAVESRDAELLDLTAQHCRAHGRLMASIADPTGACHSAGWRLRVNKKGKQSPPVHDGLTVLWRLVRGMRQRSAFEPLGEGWNDPLYVGLRICRQLKADGDDLGGMALEQPGHVPLCHKVLVYRWNGGHQVVIPRPRPNFSGDTSGSANKNVVASWLRADYGQGKRGASKLSFGVKWETNPPPTPDNAKIIEMGPCR